MKINFISILLCDNDYKTEIDLAISILSRYFQPNILFYDEERIKDSIIDLIIGMNTLSFLSKDYITHKPILREYLEKKLRIVFSEKAPNLDHDGGSVTLDINTMYTWWF